MEKILKSDNEWRNQLSEQEFNICREKGTERAFSGKYESCKDTGIYTCTCCGSHLFDSETKFDSGTGWPSFFAPISQKFITEESDNSHFMNRTEVVCTKCGSHLGHVFQDGPTPTGLRYCLNSISLKFIQRG